MDGQLEIDLLENVSPPIEVSVSSAAPSLRSSHTVAGFQGSFPII